MNARDECFSNEWALYRNVVDVDIPGTIAPPFREVRDKQVECRPLGPGYGD